MWHLALSCSLLAGLASPQAADEAAPSAEVWSFERVLGRVSEYDPGAEAARSRLSLAQLGVEDAKNAFYPAITVTAGLLAGTLEDRNLPDWQLGVKATPILDGYERFFAGRLAALEVRLGELAEREAHRMLESQVRESYLTLISMARAEEHLMFAVEHARRLVEMAGLESEPDLAAVRQLEASVVLERERMGLRSLQARRDQERARLKVLLGLAPDAPFAIDPETPPAEVLPGARGEKQDSTDAERAEMNLEAARQRLRVARFASFPQPAVRLGFDRGGAQFRSGAYVFVGVDIPLFDWGARKRQRARAALEVADRERELRRASLERESNLARLDMRRAALDRQNDDIRLCIDLATRRLGAQRTLYESGRVPAADLTRTQLEVARGNAELALNDGALWAVRCQRRMLLELGVSRAP